MKYGAWCEWQELSPFQLQCPTARLTINLTYLEIEHPEKIRLLDDEEEILPGMRARWVGVHHRSSMAFDVSTTAGHVVITDAAFHYGNVEKMHPLGILESMEECHLAYQWLQHADILVPLYDPAVIERYPDGHIRASREF